MKAIQERGHGAIAYMRQEGRGIGLYSKMQAYALQDTGLDTLDANLALGLPGDARKYDFAAEMLYSMGVSSIELGPTTPTSATSSSSTASTWSTVSPSLLGSALTTART